MLIYRTLREDEHSNSLLKGSIPLVLTTSCMLYAYALIRISIDTKFKHFQEYAHTLGLKVFRLNIGIYFSA